MFKAVLYIFKLGPLYLTVASFWYLVVPDPVVLPWAVRPQIRTGHWMLEFGHRCYLTLAPFPKFMGFQISLAHILLYSVIIVRKINYLTDNKTLSPR